MAPDSGEKKPFSPRSARILGSADTDGPGFSRSKAPALPTVGDSRASRRPLYRRSAIPAQAGTRFTDTPCFSRSRQCGPRRPCVYAPQSPAVARRSSAHSTTPGIKGQPPRHASRREQPGHAPRMRSRKRLNASLHHASAIVVGLSCTS